MAKELHIKISTSKSVTVIGKSKSICKSESKSERVKRKSIFAETLFPSGIAYSVYWN